MVQSEMMKSHVDILGEVVGWKVGASNNPAMKRLGIAEPFRGPLFSSYVRRGAADAMTWKELGSAFAALECELCFTLANPLPPKQEGERYSEEEVVAAIASVCPAIELASLRTPDALPFGPDTLGTCVADSALNGVCVLGEQIAPADWATPRLEKVAVKLAVAGTEGEGSEVDGESSRVLGSPLQSLTWLVNHLSARGLSLAKGHVVMTGAATLMVSPQVQYGTPCTVTAKVWMRGPEHDPSVVELKLT
mmetsp:Transcript_8083/g.19099  ORF Transcript_8083/g.19099 Transcript_8083/m.19099 type:complete len:249 (-) Transcript_8083:80-826(-)